MDPSFMGAPSGYTSPSLQMHKDLHQAVHDLNNRGLVMASRWAAEQLVGLEYSGPEEPPPSHTQAGSLQDKHPRVLLGRCYMENKVGLHVEAIHSGIDNVDSSCNVLTLVWESC